MKRPPNRSKFGLTGNYSTSVPLTSSLTHGAPGAAQRSAAGYGLLLSRGLDGCGRQHHRLCRRAFQTAAAISPDGGGIRRGLIFRNGPRGVEINFAPKRSARRPTDGGTTTRPTRPVCAGAGGVARSGSDAEGKRRSERAVVQRPCQIDQAHAAQVLLRGRETRFDGTFGPYLTRRHLC